MELMLVCRARWAMVAWMHAVDDDMERYDPDHYAHLCAERDTLIDALMAHERGGEAVVREVVQESYAVHVGRQAA